MKSLIDPPSWPRSRLRTEQTTVDGTDDDNDTGTGNDNECDGGGPPAALEPGARIADRFVIERPVGAGGQAWVYLARDERSADAHVAVKVLHRPSPRDLERLVREAEVLATLHHPGIVRYLGHGPLGDGSTYIVMEWLEGEDLGRRLQRGPLPVAEALMLTERVAETLAIAHAAGIVHRDVKPSNVVLPRGEIAHAKLLDFGIARVLRADPRAGGGDGGARVERTIGLESLVGTLGYMAPEQARCELTIDARADVFSLGCVLFRCLTGRTPHQGNDRLEFLARIALEAPPRLRDVWPEAPRLLDDLLALLLATNADDRPRNGAAVAAELRSLRALDASHVPPVDATLAVVERLLVSVVLARSTATPAHDEWLIERGLDRTAVTCGARLVRLADDGVAFVLASRGAATDLAVRAARCALAVSKVLEREPVALATGRTEGGRAPIGPVIERAATLLRAADGGVTVLLDEMSAALLNDRFELAAGPAGAALLRAERSLRDSVPVLLGRPASCVGRDGELRILRALFDDVVLRRRPRAALVVAPPGGGKSRLRTEFVRALTGAGGAVDETQVLTARADTMTEGAPFSLLIDAIERWAGLAEGQEPASRAAHLRASLAAAAVADDELEHACEFLGELVRANVGEPSVRLRAARDSSALMGDQLRLAFQTFVRAVSAARPLVIVLEDLHWGDRPSVRFVEHALEDVHDRAVLVLALARPEVHAVFPGLWAASAPAVITLGPLDAAACGDLVRAALPDVPAAALDAMVERSGGNPFFLEELIRAAHTARERGDDAAPDATVLPPTVVAMVQARIEALESGARRVLRAGSVFGACFWLGAVSALLGPHGIDDWIAELVAREWITERPTSSFLGEREFAFSHVLVREAAYAMLTDADRAAAHRAAGDWLERSGEGDPTLLAGHFESSAQPARAARSYLRAAKQALDGLDFDRARDDGHRGLRVAEERALRGELHLLLANVHRARSETALFLEHALQTRDHAAPASASWLEATGLAAQGFGRGARVTELRAAGEDLAAVVPTDETRATWVVACGRTSISLFQMGERALATRVLALAEAQVARIIESHPDAAATVYATRFSRCMREGDVLAACDASRTSRELFERAGDRRAALGQESNLAYATAELGDYATAERVFRLVLAQGEALRNADATSLALQNLGNVRARAGALDEGIAVLRESIAQSRAAALTRTEAFAHIYLALAHGFETDWVASEAQARAAFEMGAAYPSCRAFALAVLARALLGQGRVAEALPAAEAGEALRATLGPLEGEAAIGLALYLARRDAGDLEGAQAARHAALARLDARANRLPLGPVRDAFLHRVAEHAALEALRR